MLKRISNVVLKFQASKSQKYRVCSFFTDKQNPAPVGKLFNNRALFLNPVIRGVHALWVNTEDRQILTMTDEESEDQKFDLDITAFKLVDVPRETQETVFDPIIIAKDNFHMIFYPIY